METNSSYDPHAKFFKLVEDFGFRSSAVEDYRKAHAHDADFRLIYEATEDLEKMGDEGPVASIRELDENNRLASWRIGVGHVTAVALVCLGGLMWVHSSVTNRISADAKKISDELAEVKATQGDVIRHPKMLAAWKDEQFKKTCLELAQLQQTNKRFVCFALNDDEKIPWDKSKVGTVIKEMDYWKWRFPKSFGEGDSYILGNDSTKAQMKLPVMLNNKQEVGVPTKKKDGEIE